ncbi:sugar ABC transporter permease, partial [Dactylosporangium sp. NPDC051485]|uniref:carbohydrate ABC transporter permease n=1 Tax=Dactylosporangium sp. NPDC051485 TaxID=3154846 RepID=UPI0034226836
MSKSYRLRHALTVASFMAPATVGIVVFFVYPLASAVYFSFTKFDLLTTPEWVGLRNYRHMFEDSFLSTAVRNTLWFVVFMVPARMLGGLGSALLLTKFKKSAGLYRTIFYLPALAPPVAATLAFVYLLKPGVGPVNTALSHLGVQGPLWFNSPDWSKPSLVLLA